MKVRKIFILSIVLATLCANTFAREMLPCSDEQLSTEIRAIGIGHGETAFEALSNAVSNAMSKVKANVATMFPEKNLEYSFLSKSTSEGEQVELETTLGQPSICQEEIDCKENQCIVTIVLNFDISAWQEEQKSNITE